MKPFNLEEYLDNPSRKIVTREGKPARIISTDVKGASYSVLALVDKGDYEMPTLYTKKGEYNLGTECSYDLFFAPEKPKVEKFDPNTLQPFDKVLAKDGFPSKWTCSFFSHMDNDVSFPVYCSGGYFKVCIPYNEETKHLVGTSDDCPEYYKWWKDE